jgi:putative transposase
MWRVVPIPRRARRPCRRWMRSAGREHGGCWLRPCKAEVDQYIAELVGERDQRGQRLVTRNGHARPRTITTAAGPIRIQAPRVNDRRVDPATGKKKRCQSAIVPPWARRSPKVTEVLPLLYLHGLSTGDFAPAREGFFGSAAGLSGGSSCSSR